MREGGVEGRVLEKHTVPGGAEQEIDNCLAFHLRPDLATLVRPLQRGRVAAGYAGPIRSE